MNATAVPFIINSDNFIEELSLLSFSYLGGMSPYISLKIKKRYYEHHIIEAHKYLITWISDDIFLKNSG